MTATAETIGAQVAGVWEAVARDLSGEGCRFAGLMGTAQGEALLLSVHLARLGGITTREIVLPAGVRSYPALMPAAPAALWYERELHDRFGVAADEHPALEPLILPGPAHPQVAGHGLFTMSHGPVRSGVMESIEYLVETPGEDIPHLGLRVFYKHRGIEKRFEQLSVADGALLAERTEGVASVAHALAYCHAIEALAGVTELPRRGALVRVLYAELERLTAHLDVAVRLCDSAGLAAATARFGTHKERVARLVSRMCGSRFGRGVVVPGGVSAVPQLPASELAAELGRLEHSISGDARALMGTASFLDRLRGTGPLLPERADEHGALGPVGKASGYSDDARLNRPYDAYPELDLGSPHGHGAGDALARLRVRWDEVRQSFELLRQAAGGLDAAGEGPLAVAVEAGSGRAVGWAEAPAGEVLYDVAVESGRLLRCRPRSPSFHNLVLFPEVFAGDILTDFPFIEASFGLSPAGVAL
jgi:Ni,Fe-hydrogenase III large subunit